LQIKQWAESQAARHVLDDEDEFQQEPLIPQIEASIDFLQPFEHVLVVPSTMAVIIQTLPKTPVGNISVRYLQLDSSLPDEEFDDDEQLYAAANMDVSRRKYPDTDISLYAVSDAGNKPALAILVPHFSNAITEKLVAKKIAALVPDAKAWFAFAPCQLNNGVSISKLDTFSGLFPGVPLLQPPHFITGISAAVVSALANQGKQDKVSVLVLNSEGHPGFEKVDADAIMDAATEAFGETLPPASSAEFLKKLSGVVRKVNSASTSGMYL
ncbi:hypothetical protein METBIDRAFT_48160, partial [Metschnikowia bicuspidata var. bicuspidata NRRL YB-4993]